MRISSTVVSVFLATVLGSAVVTTDAKKTNTSLNLRGKNVERVLPGNKKKENQGKNQAGGSGQGGKDESKTEGAGDGAASSSLVMCKTGMGNMPAHACFYKCNAEFQAMCDAENVKGCNFVAGTEGGGIPAWCEGGGLTTDPVTTTPVPVSAGTPAPAPTDDGTNKQMDGGGQQTGTNDQNKGNQADKKQQGGGKGKKDEGKKDQGGSGNQKKDESKNEDSSTATSNSNVVMCTACNNSTMMVQASSCVNGCVAIAGTCSCDPPAPQPTTPAPPTAPTTPAPQTPSPPTPSPVVSTTPVPATDDNSKAESGSTGGTTGTTGGTTGNTGQKQQGGSGKQDGGKGKKDEGKKDQGGSGNQKKDESKNEDSSTATSNSNVVMCTACNNSTIMVQASSCVNGCVAIANKCSCTESTSTNKAAGASEPLVLAALESVSTTNRGVGRYGGGRATVAAALIGSLVVGMLNF